VRNYFASKQPWSAFAVAKALGSELSRALQLGTREW
jgi:hypothetical protein